MFNMGRTTFKKKITSPELISQINPKNVKLINLFLKENALVDKYINNESI